MGETSNLQRRLEFHNEDGKGFTARYRPWEVAFSMEYTSREDALASERKIKGWKSKKMIERVIQGKIVP